MKDHLFVAMLFSRAYKKKKKKNLTISLESKTDDEITLS